LGRLFARTEHTSESIQEDFSLLLLHRIFVCFGPILSLLSIDLITLRHLCILGRLDFSPKLGPFNFNISLSDTTDLVAQLC
jgi:hypothetical protein